MSRRAVICSRISKDRAGAGLGVDRQRKNCYKALLADLEAGRADAVLGWHTDRLHRRPVELEHYMEVCEWHGVVTQTVKAGDLDLDLATPSGRKCARMLGSAARYEVEHTMSGSSRRSRRPRTPGVTRADAARSATRRTA